MPIDHKIRNGAPARKRYSAVQIGSEPRENLKMRVGAPTSRNRMKVRLAPFDLACLSAAPFIALALRDPGLLYWDQFPAEIPITYQYAFFTICCAVPSFLIFRLSEGMTRFFSVHDVFAVCAAVATTVSASSVLLFVLTRLDGVPRSTPLIYALVLGGGLIVGRTISRVFGNERVRARGEAAPDQLRKIVLIGADPFSGSLIKLLDSQVPQTTRVVAILDDSSQLAGRSINGVRIVGNVGDLGAVIDEYVIHGVEIDAVWISERATALSDEALQEVQQICAHREIFCESMEELFGLQPKASNLNAVSAESDQISPKILQTRYFKMKRLADILISVCLAVFLLPLWGLVFALVLVDVGTPVLFWQERIGRGGRRFLVHKFRTYRAPFDWLGNPVRDEERLSKLGRFIRAVRFDELPQLLNVVVGDMSLIGPRPLLPNDQPADPSVRLSVRPGITGWAQANAGNLVTPEEKDALDEYYVRNASFRLDMEIIWLTLKVLFGGEKLNSAALAQAKRSRGDALDDAAE